MITATITIAHTTSIRLAPDRARAERMRRVNAPSYRRKVKTLARWVYAYLQGNHVRDTRIPKPTRGEVRELIHEVLTPIAFESKRRNRDSRGSGHGDTPSAATEAVPTSSLSY